MRSAGHSKANRARAAVVAVGAAVVGLFAGSAIRPVGLETASLITPAKAAALVAATAGASSVEVEAVGEQAKVINAALPFSRSPIAPARPFSVAGSSLDRNRALLCLTQAVYYEAGFEPVAGRRAVAQVVLNRMRHTAFPNSVCGVVYQASLSRICQFTFVCDGALYRRPEADAWRQAQAIAEAALAGYVERSVGSATHYHADYVAPRWAPLLAKVAKIGAHIFYRWPGSWGQSQAFVGRYIGEPADPASLLPAPAVRTEDGDLSPFAVADAGPAVRRAPNDVGGLLDTSKGWTLNIPDPREGGSAAARVIEKQQQDKAAAAITVASAAPSPASGRSER